MNYCVVRGEMRPYRPNCFCHGVGEREEAIHERDSRSQARRRSGRSARLRQTSAYYHGHAMSFYSTGRRPRVPPHICDITPLLLYGRMMRGAERFYFSAWRGRGERAKPCSRKKMKEDDRYAFNAAFRQKSTARFTTATHDFSRGQSR